MLYVKRFTRSTSVVSKPALSSAGQHPDTPTPAFTHARDAQHQGDGIESDRTARAAQTSGVGLFLMLLTVFGIFLVPGRFWNGHKSTVTVRQHKCT